MRSDYDLIPVGVEKNAREGRLFSLDIFDTLIVRACHHPADVFRLVGNDFDLSQDEADFSQKRVRAETVARKRAELLGRNEITLAEIYQVLQLELGIDDTERDTILQREIELEKALSLPSRFGTQLVRYLQETNTRFVLTSDMYLPREVIESMLEKCGISGHEAFFLSSELGTTKHHGGLYDVVKEYFGGNADKIVHVGDNAFADKVQAQKAGLRTIHRPAVREVFSKREIWERSAMLCGPAPIKMVFNGTYAEAFGTAKKHPLDHAFSSPDAYWRSFGWLVVAPVVFSLANWIAETCRREDIKHIGFFARDGAFPKRVFDLLFDDFETNYVAASRQFLTLPTSVLSPTELRNYFNQHEQHEGSRASYLDALPGSDALGARLEMLGFDLAEPIGKDRDAFLNALGENAGLIMLKLQDRRRAAEEYLRETLKPENPVAVFDLGWRGSLQASLGRMLPEYKGNVLGLYFGTTDEAVDKLLVHDFRYRSFSMHNGAPEPYRAACQDNTDVIEFLFSSDHGSVEDVRRAGDTFEWVSSPVTKAEAEAQEIARKIQDGAIEAIEHTLRYVPVTTLQSIDSRPAELKAFFTVLENPSIEDAAQFKDVRVFSGIGDTEGSPLLGMGNSFFSRIRTTRWRAGFNAAMSRNERRLMRLYGRSQLLQIIWRRIRP